MKPGKGRFIVFLSMALALTALAGTAYLERHLLLSYFYRKHWLTDPRGKPRLGVILKETRGGVSVSQVMKNGPAAEAHFKIDDVLLQVNNSSVSKFEDVLRALDQCIVGDVVPFVIRRGNERLEVKVVLGGDGK